MRNQPEGLQQDLLSCSRETRQWVLGLAAEVERLSALVHTCPKCGMNCIDCLCVRAHLADCHGLLETAVEAMSSNGIQCGLTPAWLDEAIRVIGWDDED